MVYRLYLTIITVICLSVIYKLIMAINEKAETDRINQDIKWKNFRFQIINKNLYYLYALEKKENDIREYFDRQQIYNVAIYGMDEIGKGFVQRFMNAGVNVCYGIDKNNNIPFDLIEIRQVENIDDQIDLIIVAAEMYFKEISNSIKGKVPIRKLSEVCEEILVISHQYNT